MVDFDSLKKRITVLFGAGVNLDFFPELSTIGITETIMSNKNPNMYPFDTGEIVELLKTVRSIIGKERGIDYNDVDFEDLYQYINDVYTETSPEVNKIPHYKIPEELEMADYLKYRKSEHQSFASFRRMNVDKMIENVHKELKKLFSKKKKKVLFGISPFAVYRTNKSIRKDGWVKGSYHSAGALQCYSELYSDVYKWMKKGWIDYVVPQDYFSFDRPDVSYHDIAWWWANICKETNTILYIGHGLYQCGSTGTFASSSWQNPHEMKNQLCFNCNFDNIKGSIFFTYKDLLPSDNEIKNENLADIKKLWNQK